jgi:hypothetical protein
VRVCVRERERDSLLRRPEPARTFPDATVLPLWQAAGAAAMIVVGCDNNEKYTQVRPAAPVVEAERERERDRQRETERDRERGFHHRTRLPAGPLSSSAAACRVLNQSINPTH